MLQLEEHIVRKWSVSLLVAVGLALPAAGCSDDDVLTELEVEQLRDSGEQRGAELVTQLQTEMAAIVSPEELLGNVAGVTAAVNDGQIVIAELARQRSDNANVILLAEEILREHTALEQRQATLLEARGVVPIDNTVSRTIRTQTTSELELLSAVDQEDLALEFVRAQIELGARDEVVVRGAEPMVVDDAFRLYLSDLADTLEANVDEAAMIGRSRL